MNGFSLHTVDAGDVLPLRSTKNILMTFEDTDRYQLFGERADAEWAAASPLNDGYVHFGEGHRFFATAVAHEMHCVQVLRMSIANPAHPKVNYAHSAHCLNYLRVYALCNADLTLEKFDPWKGNFTENQIAQTHVCRNWEDAYDLFAENTKEWLGMGGNLRTPD
ncbi:hypothetical protein SCHPADRAFT_825182 [Schizopora paradoxa]|uniref:Uncharacterized protein n=1 Tax=Schizopora paradoxa TaxID=27342 RepID=A0A0H2RT22_9AGAM|nr:hypothetical protein SCHPADRAFT_825182 [Schizopora paradoxa]